MTNLKDMDKTETWKKFTVLMNNVVGDYNQRGEKMTDELRSRMEETRVLMTIYCENNIRNMFAEEVYNHLK